MAWRGHCAPGLLRCLKFGPKVTNFALFRIHLTSKRDDWVGHIAWPNEYNYPSHGYAIWSLVRCSCAEILRHFKNSILTQIPFFELWSTLSLQHEVSHPLPTALSYSPGYVLCIDDSFSCSNHLVQARDLKICSFAQNRLFALKSPKQIAHIWSNEACMHSTRCMLSTGTTITIIDWFIVGLHLEMY